VYSGIDKGWSSHAEIVDFMVVDGGDSLAIGPLLNLDSAS
jgi:hypothetical protein